MAESYSVIEVKEPAEKRQFLEFPVSLYRDDPSYIRPLDRDVEDVFDPRKNKMFRNGEAARFIALNSGGQICGRIAVFYNQQVAKKNSQPTGGVGFFDCINSREAAFLLFDTSRDWLRSRGMEAMDGPVNFGDRNKFWGLLVEGFEEPHYCMNYNFPYYRELFESYGFRNYFEQYTYLREVVEEGLDPVLYEKAVRVSRNPDYSVRHINRHDRKYLADWFCDIYNKAWKEFDGATAFTPAHARALLKSLRPIMDERLIWLVLYKDIPVSFFVMVPEINSVIAKLNGKLDLAGKIKFLYQMKIARSTVSATGLIFGVVPDHQRKGLEGAMVREFAMMALKPSFPYRHLLFIWIGDFNPTMMKLLDQIGGKIIRTHITYRYMFDPGAPFKRYGLVNR